jgi:hypothetical protein
MQPTLPIISLHSLAPFQGNKYHNNVSNSNCVPGFKYSLLCIEIFFSTAEIFLHLL